MTGEISFDHFKANADRLAERVENACAAAGRSVDSVRVLPVTKTHGPGVVCHVRDLGWPAVGENRVQEARDKKPQCPEGLRWELIGPLQSNKARLAVELFDRIQTVEREKIARVLDRLAGEAGRVLPVLIEVNAGDDPAKHGCTVDDAPRLVEYLTRCEHLRLEGLMTVAPLGADGSLDAAAARACFRRLRGLRDDLERQFVIELPELSMGMTSDLEIAIEEGSTMVRVGSALFGERG